MSKSSLILCFFILYSSFACGQSLDSLSDLIHSIQKGNNDSIRLTSNKKFFQEFEKILLQKESFSRNFDSLKNVSVLASDDNKLKVYTWVVPHYDGLFYDYFGFIQIHLDTSNILIRLIDSTAVIRKPDSEKLNPERWLGAVYYGLIPIKKSGKTYYTLLGWKGKNQELTQKIIEVLYFSGNQIKFGYPLIKTGTIFRNRMLFTYSALISMTLNYNNKSNGIVFDHFSTNKNNPTQLPGPDGTYDILKNKKGRWRLFTNVDVGIKWEPAPPHPIPHQE